MDRIRTRGSGVAHCPLSNAYFSNAVFPLRAALEKGVRVGLGTDIAGGPSASIFDACRMAVTASRMLEDGVDASASGRTAGTAEVADRFPHSTPSGDGGGADVLDLPVGRFAAGNAFDALIVDTEASDGGIRIFDAIDTAEDVLAKILHTASRRNIVSVFVAGRALRGE